MLPASHEILTAMITPAVLISASGTLVLSTSNRLTRVVDRVRTLAKEAQAMGREPASEEHEKHRATIARQLKMLTERVSLLRSAMTVLYAAIGLFILTSITIGVTGAIHLPGSSLSVVFALGGTGALLYVSGLLVQEARLAVVSTLDEMAALEASIGVGGPSKGDQSR